MDRFARGTLHGVIAAYAKPPPVVATSEPRKPAPAPEPAPAPATPAPAAADVPKRPCDLASACPQCGTMMQPEHAHYRCMRCGYRDSCCF
jgi:hypothetical protein